ncbi:MAG: rRNA cytosine-C5-methylase, partial [Gluconobacter oxydans]
MTQTPSNTSPRNPASKTRNGGPRRPQGGRTPQRRPAPDPTRDLAFDIVWGVVEQRRMLETTLD